MVGQGRQDFKQTIWTRHWPCLGTSVSPLHTSQDPLSGNVADGKVLGKAGQTLIRVLRSHVLLVLFGGHSMISFSPGSEPTPVRPVASPEPRLSSCALPFPRGSGSSGASVSEGGKERPHLGARLPWQIGASPPHKIWATWHGRSALKATSIDIAARAASPGSSLQRIPKSHAFFQFTISSFADVPGCLGGGLFRRALPLTIISEIQRTRVKTKPVW